jgi:dTDP-4-amino-4,6-dideoxygalactose transaminase
MRAALTAPHAAETAKQNLRALLQNEFSAYGVLLTASGTQALQLAIKLAASGLGQVSSVALPAFTCYDVASAAVGAGHPIRLFDLDPATLAPDLDSVRKVLEQGARIIVISPLYGFPVDWDELSNLAAQYDAELIEDAAQGHGAAWREQRLGSLGDISVLSFGRGKGWTGGRGGALLLRGRFKNAGIPLLSAVNGAGVLLVSAAQWLLGRPAMYGLPAALPWLGLGETRYHDPKSPATMAGRAAALLLATRDAATREAAIRKQTAREYVDKLEDLSSGHVVTPLPEASPGFLRFPVRIDGGYRALVRTTAVQRWGIAPSYPTTLAALPQVQRVLLPDAHSWPGAEILAADLLTLPTHSLVRGTERRHLIRFLARRGGAAD